ncbi:MAG: hypothetical protein Q9179_002705 [Wetmoreana sp. 5 TL-2023]
MSDDHLSHRTFYDLCEAGHIESIRNLLEIVLPTWPQERQASICSHVPDHCNDIPCTARILIYCRAAVEGNQTEVFGYLWDKYLAPRGAQAISWPCLNTAAFQGDISLAKTFWSRDPDCFQRTQPPGICGPPEGYHNSQFKIAIRSDRYEYIDFMLAHGADINVGFPESDLLKMVVRCAVDDQTTLRRIRFLVPRGARIRDSGALCEVVAGGSIELATCLLDKGADVNMSQCGSTPPLMLAAAQGYEEMVRLLLDRGADVSSVDGEGRDSIDVAREKGHEGVTSILEAHKLRGPLSSMR